MSNKDKYPRLKLIETLKEPESILSKKITMTKVFQILDQNLEPLPFYIEEVEGVYSDGATYWECTNLVYKEGRSLYRYNRVNAYYVDLYLAYLDQFRDVIEIIQKFAQKHNIKLNKTKNDEDEIIFYLVDHFKIKLPAPRDQRTTLAVVTKRSPINHYYLEWAISDKFILVDIMNLLYLFEKLDFQRGKYLPQEIKKLDEKDNE